MGIGRGEGNRTPGPRLQCKCSPAELHTENGEAAQTQSAVAFTSTNLPVLIVSVLVVEEASGNFPRLVQGIDNAVLRNATQDVESLKVLLNRAG